MARGGGWTLGSGGQVNQSPAQVALLVKNLPTNAGDTRDSDSIPGVGNGNPLQYFCLEKRSLAGYSPWGCKESDMTEHAHTQNSV